MFPHIEKMLTSKATVLQVNKTLTEQFKLPKGFYRIVRFEFDISMGPLLVRIAYDGPVSVEILLEGPRVPPPGQGPEWVSACWSLRDIAAVSNNELGKKLYIIKGKLDVS